ncbi:hypothetical protein MYCTH_2307018 [Thermothelomyces thermophilus ATCC 42464]|uniref:Uncharacterized protein n=1 Tax=Thermothelomyces thermophilus (strain ATCC 42464 / BCRC 31852 / DSM 1799) TaxID=573729 RepID=G2QF44_THET4|nr:uncharacterized protein MYCTH_2307018 [Thermothelomyces thermophilus ATCC 42464]AEO59073.1 hypothetical protein MYCTH_2307018 [Thermothelomyces thermophilus ATCC 42464]
MLLLLIWQVARQGEVVLEIVYRRVMEADQRTVRSVSLLRGLAEMALKVQTFCFVAVDGLDECDGSHLGPEDAQEEVA